MYGVGDAFRNEARSIMETMGLVESPLFRDVSTILERELSQPIKLQMRLDASFLAVVVRSLLPDLRARLYALLGSHSIDFPVASGCENIARAFPHAEWGLKAALSGELPHAKLSLEKSLSREEALEALRIVDIPHGSSVEALDALQSMTGEGTVRRMSFSPGKPIRVEVFSEWDPGPGGGTRIARVLGGLTGMFVDADLDALVEADRELVHFGRQAFVLGLDSRGIRKGLKVEYSNVPVDVIAPLLGKFTQAPMFAIRRLQIAQRELGLNTLDHLSIRLRAGRPAHLTAYFARSYVSVA